MGLFSKILNKLGIKKDDKEETASAVMGKKDVVATPKSAPAKPASVKPVVSKPVAKGAVASDHLAEKKAMLTEKHVAAASVPMVDVLSKLESMAEGSGLDWKVSIVDLLKVLGIDSSLAARKELATELGCPADVMADNVKMNVWLHKTVLAEIAKNGGNIPKELLD